MTIIADDLMIQAHTADPELMLRWAIAAMRAPKTRDFRFLDALPAAIYTTDADGRITYYNRACVDFSGRRAAIGRDSWCVTWKLYTDEGAFLPHDQCPMAVAIREKRPVRGVEAIAERPDGTRVNFVPYPTPLLDEDGNLVGAINMLVDVTDRKRSDTFRAEATRCRRLANSVNDPHTVGVLDAMAAEYDEKALALGRLN